MSMRPSHHGHPSRTGQSMTDKTDICFYCSPQHEHKSDALFFKAVGIHNTYVAYCQSLARLHDLYRTVDVIRNISFATFWHRADRPATSGKLPRVACAPSPG